MITPEERARLRALSGAHPMGLDRDEFMVMWRALPALLDALEAAEAERDEARIERDGALCSVPALQRELDAARVVLSKINDIRNSIIAAQKVNWSEHVYPLVAALNEAGLEGMDYPEALKVYGTMLARTLAAEARAATAREEADALRGALHRVALKQCPACPGSEEKGHDDRCWIGVILLWVPGPELAGALAALLPTPEAPQESALDRYERLADEFWRETGYMAPGKDAPAMLYTEEQDAARRVVWDAWIAKRNATPEAER